MQKMKEKSMGYVLILCNCFWTCLCEVEVDGIVIALNTTGDGCNIFAIRFDRFPEQMDTLTCIHVPIDKFI